MSSITPKGRLGVVSRRWPWVLFALCTAFAGPARAELSSEELAKIAQNPVGNLVSVPFQNNANLNFGPEKKTQDTSRMPSAASAGSPPILPILDEAAAAH